MNKTLVLILALLATLLLGGYLVKKNLNNLTKTNREVDANILLEKVKSVTKLITVEGYFSEIYENEEYWGYNFSPLRKKALIRVKAKVAVGYDLTKVKFETETDQKLISISRLPEPKILSIDHDLDYYDITEGSFNSFSESDFNKMNAEAKKKIEQVALKSELLDRAKNQKDQIFQMIRFMVESAGWEIEMEEAIMKEKASSELNG